MGLRQPCVPDERPGAWEPSVRSSCCGWAYHCWHYKDSADGQERRCCDCSGRQGNGFDPEALAEERAERAEYERLRAKFTPQPEPDGTGL